MSQESECPHGGPHVVIADDDGYYCQKCFEPIKENEVMNAKKSKSSKKPADKKPAKNATGKAKPPKAPAAKKESKNAPVEKAEPIVEVKQAPPVAENRPGNLSLLDAAAVVLKDFPAGTTVAELFEAVVTRKLWVPRAGKTPQQTLAAAICTEIKKRGTASRFVRSGRGLFKAVAF